jgi:hypothetical protein
VPGGQCVEGFLHVLEGAAGRRRSVLVRVHEQAELAVLPPHCVVGDHDAGAAWVRHRQAQHGVPTAGGPPGGGGVYVVLRHELRVPGKVRRQRGRGLHPLLCGEEVAFLEELLRLHAGSRCLRSVGIRHGRFDLLRARAAVCGHLYI